MLGGGIVVGSIVLVGGEPGIGKSTLLLQAAAGACAAGEATVLYATGEESAAQVRLRAERLGLLGGPAGDSIRVVAESDVGRIAELARSERPTLVIVDSIQTATVDELDGPAGSVGQVRESALRLAELAKSESIAVVLVGHVTKDGSLAGPKTLEHLVDAVLALEGERFSPLRIVRASKNRFGSTEEVGVFEMGASGLAELDDPARAFLADHDGAAQGSVVAPTLEGSRPNSRRGPGASGPGPGGTPRRTASGVDPNRVALLIAVLGRRAGIGLGSHDVYVNFAGGLTVESRPWTSRSPSPSRPRSATGPCRRHGRDRRDRAARRAAPRTGPRPAAARGCQAGLHPGDRPGSGRRPGDRFVGRRARGRPCRIAPRGARGGARIRPQRA